MNQSDVLKQASNAAAWLGGEETEEQKALDAAKVTDPENQNTAVINEDKNLLNEELSTAEQATINKAKTIAKLGAKYIELCNKYGDELWGILEQIGTLDQQMVKDFRGGLKKSIDAANQVIEAFKTGKFNTGDMISSTLSDSLETVSGQTLYPPQWEVQKSDYSFTKK
jgi:hypothetical protein